ncbi:MAG: M48 family metallopeptidase [Lachnospiraceae bacterium]
MKYDIKIIRSRRKSIALEIDRNLQVLVRAPYQMSIDEIRRFVAEKENWIEKHLIQMQMRQKEYEKTAGSAKISMEEIHQLAEEALKVIPERVAYYAPLVGVTYGRITIRNQRSRWGSCSGKGNLNFNCLLMKVPPEVLDYVVVHELCHRKEMNHSKRFWAEVERVLPDYRENRRWLKEQGSSIIESMG